MERSLQSGYYCFTDNLFKTSLMPDIDYHIHRNWFEHFSKQDHLQLDRIIYLRTSVDTCWERILKRDRKEEIENVTKHLLTQLHRKHEQWLIHDRWGNTATVHIIDGDKQPAEIAAECKKLVETWVAEY